MRYALVVIGTSAGGLTALERLLAGLPSDFLLPLLIVQHRSRESDLLCEVLAARSPLPVREVLDKDPIEPGVVYLAPPDYHVLVDEGSFALSSDEPVRFARPSIDVAFESAVDTYGARVVGVVLTGANEDGAAGLRRVQAEGGLALAQDPASAEVPRMPAAALAAAPGALALGLEALAAALRAAAAAPALAPARRL
ncbi:MAG TPA: chemotaxis protein CheB [Longimicrobiales bacterium]|nr:chemotaxis protein CheB [Longimicrobiales bacterium]